MTIQNLFKQPESICRASFSLVRETGFCPGKGLGGEVCHLPDIFDDAFVGSCAGEIPGNPAQACFILFGMEKKPFEECGLYDGSGVMSVPGPDMPEYPFPMDDEDDGEYPFPLNNEDKGTERRPSL